MESFFTAASEPSDDDLGPSHTGHDKKKRRLQKNRCVMTTGLDALALVCTVVISLRRYWVMPGRSLMGLTNDEWRACGIRSYHN
jgi:hypothetical protein